MLQQKLRDLVVSVVYGRIKRVAVRRDAFFGKIRIGAIIEEQFDDLDVSAGGGVFERRSAAQVIRAVVRDEISQPWILVEQLSDTLQIPLDRGHPYVHVYAPSDEMSVHVIRPGQDLLGHVAPAAKMVIAVREMNRTRAVLALRVDVRAARQQLIDDVDLSRHYCPMNRLIGSPVSGVQEIGRFVQEFSDLLQVAFANRRRDRFSLRRGAVQAGELALKQLLHLDILAVAGDLEDVPQGKR